VKVDSTAHAFIATKDGAAPKREDLDAALKPQRFGTLTRVIRPKAAAVYDVVVDGVG
jgi:hypothetical protein